MQKIVLILTALVLIAAAAGGAFLAPDRFFQAYLVAFLFWNGISLGCLGWLLLHNMTGSRWGFAVQRVLEAGARTLPLMALLFLPLLFALPDLYLWAATPLPFGESIWLPQSSFLNVPFFLIRAAVYFAVWVGLALRLTRWSYSSDHRPQLDAQAWQDSVRLNALGLLLFVFTANFAAIDWLMSLEPEWYSSAFGWLAIARHALGALAFAILALGLLRASGRASALRDLLTARALNDVGAVFVATLLTWLYLALMQFIVIWSANIPNEVIYYLRRLRGGWLWVVLLLVAAYVALPTLLLLLRPVKRRLRNLALVAALVLAMRLVHVAWLVLPVYRPALSLHWLDLALPLGMGALWLGLFAWQLLRHPLLPANHPKLQETLAHPERRTII